MVIRAECTRRERSLQTISCGCACLRAILSSQRLRRALLPTVPHGAMGSRKTRFSCHQRHQWHYLHNQPHMAMSVNLPSITLLCMRHPVTVSQLLSVVRDRSKCHPSCSPYHRPWRNSGTLFRQTHTKPFTLPDRHEMQNPVRISFPSHQCYRALPTVKAINIQWSVLGLWHCSHQDPQDKETLRS